MLKTLTLIATATATTLAAAPAVAAPTRAFDPITGAYRASSNDYCIRSGWGNATQVTARLVRKGDCHDATEWRRRGLVFDPVRVARAKSPVDTMIAAR